MWECESVPVSVTEFRRKQKQSKSNIREHVTKMQSFVLKERNIMPILLNI